MPNLNKVMLMGNLTRDPESKQLPSGLDLVSFGLAINRRWTDQKGERQEETLFLDCEAFGKTAVTLGKYTSKGKPIYLEGRLRLDQWQSKEGEKRSKMKVVVTSFEFIESAKKGEAQPERTSQPVAVADVIKKAVVNDDDIPF